MSMTNLDILNGPWDMGSAPPTEKVFTYNLSAPGLPIQTLIATVVLLLGAYGVVHDVAADPNFNSESVNTGNEQVDARFQNDYMMFKMFLDGLSLDYANIHCNMQASAVSTYMTFTCS